MSDVTEDEERALRIATMRADLHLKTKQGFWETPRNLVVVVGATVAIVATVAGLAGYKLGSQSVQPVIIQIPAPATSR